MWPKSSPHTELPVPRSGTQFGDRPAETELDAQVEPAGGSSMKALLRVVELGRRLADETDPHQVLRAVLQEALATTRAHRGLVALLHEPSHPVSDAANAPRGFNDASVEILLSESVDGAGIDDPDRSPPAPARELLDRVFRTVEAWAARRIALIFATDPAVSQRAAVGGTNAADDAPSMDGGAAIDGTADVCAKRARTVTRMWTRAQARARVSKRRRRRTGTRRKSPYAAPSLCALVHNGAVTTL